VICTGTALDVDDEEEPEPDEDELESEDEVLPDADDELEEGELELEEDEPDPAGRTFTNRFHASQVNSSAEVHSEVFGMRVMLPTGS
jgi:hypothetical protein